MSDEKRKYSEVTLIYVRTKYHKKGIGSNILEELLEWVKGKGEKEVYVTMDDMNNASIKLHKKAGFKKVAIFMKKKFKK